MTKGHARTIYNVDAKKTNKSFMKSTVNFGLKMEKMFS